METVLIVYIAINAIYQVGRYTWSGKRDDLGPRTRAIFVAEAAVVATVAITTLT